MSELLALLLGVFAASWALTALIRGYALKRDLIDVPGERSSHTAPTPRGGGLAIVVAFALGSVYLYFAAGIETTALLAVIGGGALVAAVGFRDDHRDTRVSTRLLVHALAVSGATLLIGGLPGLPLGGFVLELGPFGAVLAVVGVVWLLNLYNFMDGIDGIAALQAISTAASAALILLLDGERVLAPWLLCLAAACAGFLVWNWPPAKLFMGDVGSGFLGFVLGAFALLSGHQAGLNLWVWLILLAVFVTDATLTLLRRIRSGERWHQAHASHAYQNAARLCGSHKKVTLAVLCINMGWLFPVATAAAMIPAWAVALTVLAYAPVLYLAIRLRAGVVQAENTLCY